MAYLCQRITSMTTYKRDHHNKINSALHNFNDIFLTEHNIIFGGGTRIAMEIDEYRESIDVDIICPNLPSYKAARSEITNISLGKLVKEEFKYLREIRADRYAIRTFIEIDNTPVKIEIISFADYRLNSLINTDIFPIPYLDKSSCYITKLLANADRALQPPYKDIIDIIVMHMQWGEIPEEAWREAHRHYGNIPSQQLTTALEHLLQNKKHYISQAESMGMYENWIHKVIEIGASSLLEQLKNHPVQYN